MLECSQHLSDYKSMVIRPDAQRTANCSPRSDLAEFRTNPRCYGCPLYQDQIKIDGARVFTKLHTDSSDAQGQLTQLSVMEF